MGWPSSSGSSPPAARRCLGQSVISSDVTVYVDGEALDEPYILEPMWDIYGNGDIHVEVPEGSIFVLGDNRNGSKDSRDAGVGTIDEDYVLGKAVFSIFPMSRFGAL